MNSFSWGINLLNFSSWEHEVLFYMFILLHAVSQVLVKRSGSSQAGLSDKTEPEKWKLKSMDHSPEGDESV